MANGFSCQCESSPTCRNQALRGLWIRREQLIDMLVMEENRLEHAPTALHRSLRAHFDYLRKQIKFADKDLDRAVRNSALWDKDELLSSVPGVGPVLSVALLADLPELGQLNLRESDERPLSPAPARRSVVPNQHGKPARCLRSRRLRNHASRRRHAPRSRARSYRSQHQQRS